MSVTDRRCRMSKACGGETGRGCGRTLAGARFAFNIGRCGRIVTAGRRADAEGGCLVEDFDRVRYVDCAQIVDALGNDSEQEGGKVRSGVEDVCDAVGDLGLQID